jgi:uncharacterized protein (DUF2252 family)
MQVCVFFGFLWASLFCAQPYAATARDAWVVQQIKKYNSPFSAQLPQELKTKMDKMALSPFIFYRGTAHLFYEDMKQLGQSSFINAANSKTWINGDIHIQNVGAFKNAAGKVVFDATDFDEGYWGPYVWDIRRMAVSILLAAKENGIKSNSQQTLVNEFVDAYLSKVSDFRGNDSETTDTLHLSNTKGEVKNTLQASLSQSRSDFLAKYTVVSGSKRVFLTSAELAQLDTISYNNIKAAVAAYVNTIASSKRFNPSYYSVKDIRIKLGSGVGSLGRYRIYVLVEGPSSAHTDDVVLQLKQETASSVSIALPGNMPAGVFGEHEGQRAALSMKAALTHTDVLAGWTTINGAPYFVREKSPYEADFDSKKLTNYSDFSDAVKLVAHVVAKIHTLADKDYDANLIPYSIDKEIDETAGSNKSGFKLEVLNFALDYAKQVELDYQSFLKAYKAKTPLY